jgi:hypothetical protein
MTPVHVVLGFHCKTDDCKEFHAIAHLGEKNKVSGYKLDLTAMGKGLSIPCPRCRQTHFYETRTATKLEITSAPPPGTPPPAIK